VMLDPPNLQVNGEARRTRYGLQAAEAENLSSLQVGECTCN
jgi:hypothetical protein